MLPEPSPARALTRLAAYPWLVVGVTCLSTFAGQVDATVVQLGLPTLERTFDVPLSAVGWVAVGYSLSYAATLPIYLRVAERAGRKLLYILGFALFGVFSALCGLAASLAWLIAFRVTLGASVALLGASNVAILVAAAGPTRRGRAMGLYSTAQAIGASLGAAVGGLLLNSLSWHWIFWVTVPFVMAGAIFAWLLVPVSGPQSSDTAIDWIGALLLTPALTALMLVLSELNAWGVRSFATLACAAASIALLATFIRHERRTAVPLVQLGLFRSPAFCGGTIGVLLSYAMLYGMFFAMSFALVRGYHEAPLSVGVRLAVIPVALGLIAPFSGAVAQPRLAMLTGMALCAAALLWLRHALNGTLDSLLPVMLGLATYGAGLGLFIAPNSSATLAAAPSEHAGQAGGLLILVRSFGTAVGVAGASALSSWRLERATGLHDRTVGADESALLSATGDVMLMLAACALVAAMAASRRDAATAQA